MFADTCVWSSFASVYSDCLVYFEDPAVCIKTVIIQCFCQNSYLFAFKIDKDYIVDFILYACGTAAPDFKLPIKQSQ